MNKKFAVVTGTRAEYGLLVPLIRKINNDPQMEVILMVTGAHLSESHGKTIEFIKKDGFKIDYIVDMEIQGDRESDICNSMAVGLKKFSEIFNDEYLDAIIVLGDRYELLPVCTAAIIHRVPIVHIHGGEVTMGLIDDAIRHSVTKMASIHFPSINLYAKRIERMGEHPQSIHVVGALFMDNIKSINLMDIDEISNDTQVNFYNDIALMTYHPVTLDNIEQGSNQVKEILEALMQTNLKTLITMPNTDTGGSKIYETIAFYRDEYPEKFSVIKNLGTRRYLSAVKYCKLMIGNSSSAITESVPFKIPVINIGDRQGGRYKTDNIVDCDCDRKKIFNAINKVISKEFQLILKKLDNPYGDGKTAEKIVEVLKSIDFNNSEKLLKKGFFDFI